MFAVFQTARRNLRQFIRFALLPASLLALAACDTGGQGAGPRIDTSVPVPVALLVPSGSGASGDEVLAQSLENAARLAMRDLGGVTIDLRVYATQGDAAIAAEQAKTAVAEGAQIILGPVYAEAANAAGLAVAQSGVNVLSFSNNTTIAGGNVFVLGATFDTTADRIVDFARLEGRSRIVIVHAQTFAEELGRDAIAASIAANRATLVGTVDYALSQEEVIAAVPRVKDAVTLGEADMIFLTSSSASALPLFSQLLPENGMGQDVVQYAGLTRWDIPAQTLSLPGVQGGWFALPDPATTDAFNLQYRDEFGQPAHPIGGLAFDGIAAIGALVAQGKGNALTTEALTQRAGFRGASGIFRLNADGTNERGLAVATITDGQVEILSPAPRSFSFGFVGF
jgi:hypothetical protein